MWMMKRALRASLLAASVVGLLPRDAAAQQACTAPKTTCGGANGYYASKEDLDRLTAVADPLLRELRTCLDAAGGKHVTPGVEIRWDSEGHPVAVRVEVPGYESLPCVAKASGKLSQLQNPHETAIRCDYGCPKPPPPLPPPAPIIVPAPPTTVTTPAAPPPTAAPQGGVVVVVPPPAKLQESPRYEKVWYGWQTLLLDGVALAMTLGGLYGGASGLTTTGVLTYVFGAPIVHMAHAEIGRGFGSMGMRVLLPLLGAGIGAIAGLSTKAGNDGRDAGEAAGTGATIGAFIGGGGCALIDATAMGYKSQKIEHDITLSPRRPSFTLAPTIDVRRGSVGLVGQF
jgi:hypothetical protein